MADPAAARLVRREQRAFCAGGDLRASDADSPFEVDPARPIDPLIELFKTFDACSLPTIARVKGN